MDFSFTEKSTFDNQFELNSGGSYTDTKLPDQNFCCIQYGSESYTKTRSNCFCLRINSVQSEKKSLEVDEIAQKNKHTMVKPLHTPFLINDVLNPDIRQELISKILDESKQEFEEKMAKDEERYRKKEKITEEAHNEELKQVQLNQQKENEKKTIFMETKRNFDENLNAKNNCNLNTEVISKRFTSDLKSNYQYAVISVAMKYTNCLVIIHAAFITESDSITYLQDIIQHEYNYLDSFVVPMYEFGNLESSLRTEVRRNAKRVYRYDIMQRNYEQDLFQKKVMQQVKNNKEFKVYEKKKALTSS